MSSIPNRVVMCTFPCFFQLRSFCGKVTLNQPRIAIVGSGPAGFYTAHQLIKQHKELHVDIFESLPVPFGLIRFGVAPDHPEVKNVINQFTTLAQSSRCRFIGNINIGKDLSITELRSLYDATVLAYGAEEDKLMNIKGESDTDGVYSARDFVGWYNGLPSCSHLKPELTSGDTAVVIGHGNVALDVARILLSPIQLLQKTDICSHALEVLSQSTINRVLLIGRRGPLQVSFTIKELREMIRLPHCQTVLDVNDLSQYKDSIATLPRPRKRLTELMLKTACEGVVDPSANKKFEIKFLRSPVEILSTNDKRASGVKFEINSLQGERDTASIISTGQHETIDCSMVLRSIGYKCTNIDPLLPFDTKRGIIRNNKGRVMNDSKEIEEGLYCSGWVKRGPTGVILNTMNDAFETAGVIIEDLNKKQLYHDKERCDVIKLLQEKAVNSVSFEDWEKIDKEEMARGELNGKPREKITSIQEMLNLC